MQEDMKMVESMPEFVIKKEDRPKEPFSFEKIKVSIEEAFKKTEPLQEDKTQMIVHVLGAVSQQLKKSRKKEIKSEDIRDIIVAQLREMGYDSVLYTWLEHEDSKSE